MKSEKFHRNLIGIAFLLIAFMYADTYLAPPRWNKEKVIRRLQTQPVSGIQSKRAPTFQLFTEQHHYYVSSYIYYATNIDDTIMIDRSWVSHSLKGVKAIHDGEVYETDLGFISSGTGVFFTVFFGFTSLLMYIFYPRISYRTGRTNLSFFLLGISVCLLIFYFFNGF